MSSIKDFHSDDPIAWCPGCGNFSILNAIKNAFVELAMHPHEIVIVSGIGQAPKTPHYLRCNTFNGLHGRTLPVATGVKLSNSNLTVLAEGGDGDGFAEGGNHFIHAMRRNIDITYIVHNNQVYGLTKGQTSPTSEHGYVSKTTPEGSHNPPMRALLLAVASECGFVARGFSGDMEHLTFLIKEGVLHKGFSFIEILQNCVSFNKVNTFEWYKKRVYKINDENQFDPWDRIAAFSRAQEWGERIPIGIFYRTDRPSLDEQIPMIKEGCLVEHKVDSKLFTEMLESFR